MNLVLCCRNFRPSARRVSWRVSCLVAGVLLVSGVLRAEDKAGIAQFEQQIRPTLVAKCLKCHGAEKQEGELRLDSREAILKGGESGPAIVPGKPEESLLVEALRYESFEMPPTGQLSEKTVAQFTTWIARGAHWPDREPLRANPTQLTAEDRDWWAFRPVVKTEPPELAGYPHPIDRFVIRRLSEQKMEPAPPADKRTLVRRLYFDVLGLPPTPDEVAAFVADDSPQAWEQLVDRLLADPRYGEHWARYWLDLVRYSESDGWNQDAYRPHIWRYRDYVVAAFNNDKPYPDFVLEQLAGDEIARDDPQRLAASGFLRLGIYEYNQRDARGHWNDIMNEMTDVAGDVFLGMSMACARCHNHKFDPLLQADYFKLRAFFEPIRWRDDLTATTPEQREQYAEKLAVWEAETEEIRAKIDALIKPYHDRKWESTVDKFPLDIQACFHKPEEERNSWEQQMAYLVSRQFIEEAGGPLKSISKEDKARHEALLKELAAFDELRPAPLPPLMIATDFHGPPAATRIPDDPEQRTIEPGFLTVLEPPQGSTLQLPELSQSTGRRTALARWIGRPDNPLTTRVIVNRIWQRHFGEGLVATPNDFGRKGQLPTHPELLDWLTATFVEQGWSFKKLHKLILTSSTWRQSTRHPQADHYQALDPAEQYLWRSRIRRLQAEQIRDAMLSVSGELKTGMGGPSVDAKEPRRTLYLKSFRNQTETFLHAFDMAPGLKSVAVRNTTTTPTQSLMMVNGDYVLGRAKMLARRLRAQSFETPEAMVRYATQLAWGRDPSDEELAEVIGFLGARDGQPVAEQALVDFAHVLFNSNEFLYLD